MLTAPDEGVNFRFDLSCAHPLHRNIPPKSLSIGKDHHRFVPFSPQARLTSPVGGAPAAAPESTESVVPTELAWSTNGVPRNPTFARIPAWNSAMGSSARLGPTIRGCSGAIGLTARKHRSPTREARWSGA